MLQWTREAWGLHGRLEYILDDILSLMLDSDASLEIRVTSMDVDNAEWWLGFHTTCWKARWSWESRRYMGRTRCGGDGRNSMLGPIQSDAYRWDGICNYSRAGLYEVCTTLQLIWEQTDGHYHDRLYVDQDHTELVRVQTKDGSILEDVRVVDMLKEQS
jgi:hypothetical protein